MLSAPFALFVTDLITIMLTFNEPYSKPSDPNVIRDDMHRLASIMEHDDLINLVSTYFSTDTLAELIDDRLMGRV